MNSVEEIKMMIKDRYAAGVNNNPTELVKYVTPEQEGMITLLTLLKQAAESLGYIKHDMNFVISQLKRLKYETNGGVIESHYNVAINTLESIQPYVDLIKTKAK